MRAAKMADLETVLDLMQRCDIEEYGEPDSDLEDLRQNWERIELAHDSFVYTDKKEQLVGYAAVLPNPDELSFELYVRNGANKREVIDRLIDACEQRARMIRAQGEQAAKQASVIVAQANREGGVALKARGYRGRKYYFRMQIELDGAPDAVQWPPSMDLRIFRPGVDDESLYEFIQTAFAKPGRTPPRFEDWRDYMMRPDHFIPELWFLLWRKERLAGASLCFEFEDYGWVRQLAVAQEERRQGLGADLLQHSFSAFYQRGYRSVALAVDSERPQAQSLYANTGMQPVSRFDEYVRELG